EVRPDIAVILCTGFGHFMEERGGIPSGLDEILLKPLVMSDLAVSVRKVLDRRSGPLKNP
ncbi:MAG: hypothetical protein DRH20_06575, partial [Deltaproteobacteria bacterium]